MSLQTALNRVAPDVTSKFVGGTMAASMATWNGSWPLIFDEEVTNERTVRDWFITSLVVEESYSSTPTDVDRQRTVDVVVRTLEAGIAAEAAGRISAGQAAALEAAYLAAW